jgi:probable HAF family extracellular repeat protein
LGAPGTMALAVNDAGTIVGQELTAKGYRHAFSWTKAGGMIDLGTLGGDMSTAFSINNKGWIVGTSLTNDGKNILHGFLWTPAGGMQDFTALSVIGGGSQPYSMQVNDYGDIAVTNRYQLVILVPRITATAVSSPNPSRVGQPVTVTVTLSSIAGPPPDGETVQCGVGSSQLGTGTLHNGVARCTISGLRAGSHLVAVIYGGDAYYLPCRYTPLTQVVNP